MAEHFGHERLKIYQKAAVRPCATTTPKRNGRMRGHPAVVWSLLLFVYAWAAAGAAAAVAAGRVTHSIRAISALSPRRGPILTMRV